ncbi:MAG: hypothetical protein VKN72_12395 [Nostocales cyanobacterium 94392]|nr:hypothetical protein [Nostocales cyanobacterium 94392]
MARKLDSDGNPMIFWDDSIEPPEPDDYDTLTEYEEAWEKWEQENSDSLICAAELEQVSPYRELSQEKFNYADYVKPTRFVKRDCNKVFPVCQSAGHPRRNTERQRSYSRSSSSTFITITNNQ